MVEGRASKVILACLIQRGQGCVGRFSPSMKQYSWPSGAIRIECIAFPVLVWTGLNGRGLD
eukprot:6412236-Lingulodinium_polyedra.AAC.1